MEGCAVGFSCLGSLLIIGLLTVSVCRSEEFGTDTWHSATSSTSTSSSAMYVLEYE